MRSLTEAELEQLDDNGEGEDGATAIETTVGELAKLGAGTVCGTRQGTPWAALEAAGFGERRVRGWYFADGLLDDAQPLMGGMIAIEGGSAEGNTEPEDPDFPPEDASVAEPWRIGQIAFAGIQGVQGGGSLRYNGPHWVWAGFQEYENE